MISNANTYLQKQIKSTEGIIKLLTTLIVILREIASDFAFTFAEQCGSFVRRQLLQNLLYQTLLILLCA